MAGRSTTALWRRPSSRSGLACSALPLHQFDTDRVVSVRAAKTIYVSFDANDYSIPPEAVGRELTLAASGAEVRILDGTREIARHRRSYNRQQLVLDPAHQ